MYFGGEDILAHSLKVQDPLCSSSAWLILDQSIEFLPDQELPVCL